MKTISLVLTILLVVPVIYLLYSAYQVYLFRNKFSEGHGVDFATLNVLSYLLVYLFFGVVTLYLNVKKKYLENSVMCGTLLLSFLLSVIISMGTSFLYTWLG